PDTLRVGTSLAVSYRAAGRTTVAVELGERLLAECERILGPEHPHTLTARADLAHSYRTVGRTGQAEPIEQRARPDAPPDPSICS
ncbi:MAG: tetratricopeptide repeat protein, partial [Actinobacteria bacterium]|nr:tetratricopeptide repeat protein [Actinomycetota bacterium]